MSASAPAFLKALAESTSQFVPGNAGITTFGLAILIAGPAEFLSVYRLLLTAVVSFLFLKSAVLTGNTPSTGSCHSAVISATDSA